jgi:predicted DNA binding CopG/RHH family protein
MDLTARIDLRLTEEEKKSIQSQATAAGLDMTTYIRAVLVHYPELLTWSQTRWKVNPVD